jgi:hypothetical protein
MLIVGRREACATPTRATDAAKARSASRTSGRRASNVAGSESGTSTASTDSASPPPAGIWNGMRPTSAASSCSRCERNRRACASAAAGTATSLSNWCTSSSEMTPLSNRWRASASVARREARVRSAIASSWPSSSRLR